ncbi:protein SFI1 homolog isoform X2 [Rhea pennata]|uniref:protein SFI1 homolog isoform X2 n=1 Tax=Rhea pennata TaxID=8795 RepID=UPI002E26D66C
MEKSKSRCCCDQKILQKSSEAWKEEWWTACREKKLILRADCHYRYFLYSLIFKAWRAYTCKQQEKRNKNYIAKSHANKQKLLWTWQRWLIYVDVRRTKYEMQSVALAFRNRNCLRISWAVWRRRRYQNCAGRKMNVLALQHWAQSLQFRAWLQWRELYLYSQSEKQKESRAVTHHQHWKLRTCMEAWLGYLNLQRTKRRQNELAQEHHQGRVVQQCFSGWRLSWECRKRMHAHQKLIEKLAAKIVLWRVFASWKHYVLCVEEAWQCELAEKHHRHHLLQFGLKGLRQNVMNARLQQMRKNLAYRQHQVTVLQNFWNRWKSRLEEKEEEQQQALTSVAHTHYKEVLMRKVFDRWWLRACKQQEYRMGEKRAVFHFERRLLVCFWSSWCRRTNVHLEGQEDLVRARDHYSYMLLLKTFCLWKQNTQERKTERLKEMQAVQLHYSKCLQRSWNKWREYVGHQCEKWKKLVRADMHYQHMLLGKAMAGWKNYQHNIQCILYQVAEKEKQHTRLLLRQLLHIWRENALALVHEAKAATRADQHYRRVILSKMLLLWRDAVSLQVYCRQQKLAAVKKVRKHLDIVHLQTLFLHWKKFTAESLRLKAKQDRAVQHHQQHLLRKYLVNWKKYRQQYIAKMLLQRQGYQLMTRRLCSNCFSCWKKQLVQRQWEKQETVHALWHWSLSLQRKAAYNLHQSVYRCAMLWKQKALYKKLNKPPSLLPPLKKQVTFKVPDANPETRGCSAEEMPQPSKNNDLPFLLAAGDSVLRELNALRQARLPPRRPDFLLESLEKEEELLGNSFTRSETSFQQTVVNKCSAQAGPLMLSSQMEGRTCNQLSQVGSTTHAYPSLVCAALPSASMWTGDVHQAVQICPRPELWPPSSFMSQMKAEAEKRGGEPVDGHTEAHFQDSQLTPVGEKLRPKLQPHLLSPEDFVGKRGHQTAAEGEEKEHNSREESVLQRQLEAELQNIQQQMQYYFSRKQELKSCQQQAQILHKWLETSTQSEDEDGIQEVQEELDQLEMRINTLTKAQVKERHHVQKLVARLHDIHIALDM